VYSPTLGDHYQHLEIVLKLLRAHQLVARATKCFFGHSQVEYLGHVITEHGVATDPLKIQAIVDWPIPTNLKQLRGFLGLTGYYHRFVKGYGSISKPLTLLLRKDTKGWTEEATHAFNHLKVLMTSAPVLALPDFTKAFVVETDASSTGIGAILLQEGHPIAFISKSLGAKQQTLSIYEREMMAILHAVTKRKHYLWGRHFHIRTDHISLKYLLHQKLTTPAQHLWVVKLLGYDYDIEYKQGRENVPADALSRIPSHELFALTTSTISTSLMEEIRSSYHNDPMIQTIIKDLQGSADSHPHYAWVHDHLNRKGKVVVGHNMALRSQIISLFHNSAVGGHSGMTVTSKTVGSLFYLLKGQQKHIRQHVRECIVCQRNKHENVASPGLLQPLPIPIAPFIDISMDFVEGLPKSEGKDVIMVIVDRFSKYAHCVALNHPYAAPTIARAFMDNIYKLHGTPASITSDRDPVFLSRFWKELFNNQGVNLHHSTAYHPQTDGQTEVVNKCIEHYLRCMTGDSPTQWAKWLPLAEWWYNTNYHSATKMTPYEVLYGFPPPIHIPYFPKDSAVALVDKYLNTKEEVIKRAKAHLQLAQHRMTMIANRKRSDRSFAIDDYVYLKLQPYRQQSTSYRSSQKLAAKYYRPYQVIEKLGVVAYKLALPSSSTIHPVLHVSQLKKHVGNHVVQSSPPITHQSPTLQPLAILDRRMTRRNNQAATQVLIHWAGLSAADATWEFTTDLQLRFPTFNLEDKVGFEGEQLLQAEEGA